MTVPESHTKGEQKHYTHLVPADPDSRSPMARVSERHLTDFPNLWARKNPRPSPRPGNATRP